MSGGAYDYLYLKLDLSIEEYIDQLEKAQKDAKRLSKTHSYFNYVVARIINRINALKTLQEPSFLKILKELEWLASGDIGPDTCEDRIRDIVRSHKNG